MTDKISSLIDAAILELDNIEYGINEACLDNAAAWEEEKLSLTEAKDLLNEAIRVLQDE